MTATIERPAGRQLAVIRMSELEEITAGELRFDPLMNPRLVRNAKEGEPPALLELQQIDPAYSYKQSWRGQAGLDYPEASEGDPAPDGESKFHRRHLRRLRHRARLRPLRRAILCSLSRGNRPCSMRTAWHTRGVELRGIGDHYELARRRIRGFRLWTSR